MFLTYLSWIPSIFQSSPYFNLPGQQQPDKLPQYAAGAGCRLAAHFSWVHIFHQTSVNSKFSGISTSSPRCGPDTTGRILLRCCCCFLQQHSPLHTREIITSFWLQPLRCCCWGYGYKINSTSLNSTGVISATHPFPKKNHTLGVQFYHLRSSSGVPVRGDNLLKVEWVGM